MPLLAAGHALHPDQRVLRGASPRRFRRFPFSFSASSGALRFSLGGWGSPCRVFPPPASVALLSSGWVGAPCRVFPVFSPWFLGGWGCDFVGSFFLLLSLASCIFLRVGLGRATWSTDPQTPRPPPPRALACVSLPISCWELTGGHAEVRGGGVTGGFVTPHNS